MSSEINCADLQNRCLGQGCVWAVIRSELGNPGTYVLLGTAVTGSDHDELFRVSDDLGVHLWKK